MMTTMMKESNIGNTYALWHAMPGGLIINVLMDFVVF